MLTGRRPSSSHPTTSPDRVDRRSCHGAGRTPGGGPVMISRWSLPDSGGVRTNRTGFGRALGRGSEPGGRSGKPSSRSRPTARCLRPVGGEVRAIRRGLWRFLGQWAASRFDPTWTPGRRTLIVHGPRPIARISGRLALKPLTVAPGSPGGPAGLLAPCWSQRHTAEVPGGLPENLARPSEGHLRLREGQRGLPARVRSSAFSQPETSTRRVPTSSSWMTCRSEGLR